MKDYYAILGISKNSTESDIRNAYRRLAKQYHPDVNKSENAFASFIEISEAYEYLTNSGHQPGKVYSKASAEAQSDNDLDETREFEQFIKNAREKAQKQAKMRYDEFKKQDESFRKSGIYDLSILLKLFFHFALIPIFFFLVLLPIQIAIHNEWQMIFLFLLTWPFAGIIAWYIFDNRRHYFITGEIYYNLDRIKKIYTEINETSQKCYYCRDEPANSKAYSLELLKLKEVKVKSSGFRQHNANYINENASVLIPRSRKAFIAHTLSSIIKILSILSCVLFLDISSYVWRIVIGMITGGFISSLMLFTSGIKSNITYLFSYGQVFRSLVWIFLISMVSDISFRPFNIITSDYIHFVITAIIIFDCFLMQAVNFVFGKYSSKPIILQYEDAARKFADGFTVYNDVAVISFIYPVSRWIFG